MAAVSEGLPEVTASEMQSLSSSLVADSSTGVTHTRPRPVPRLSRLASFYRRVRSTLLSDRRILTPDAELGLPDPVEMVEFDSGTRGSSLDRPILKKKYS